MTWWLWVLWIWLAILGVWMMFGHRVRTHRDRIAQRDRDLAVLATANQHHIDCWWPDDLSQEEWAQ